MTDLNVSTFDGVCDVCGAETAVARFRVELVRPEKSSAKSVSRTVLACVVCRAPLMAILKTVPPKQNIESLASYMVSSVSELAETPGLKAQRIGTPKPRAVRRPAGTRPVGDPQRIAKRASKKTT